MSDIPFNLPVTPSSMAFTLATMPQSSPSAYQSFVKTITNVSQNTLVPKSLAISSDEDTQKLIKKSELLASTLEADLAKLNCKRFKGETNVQYVLRLKAQYPKLNIRDAAIIAGMAQCNLWHLAEFNELTSFGLAARWLMPREEGESDGDFVNRLRLIFPEITIKDLCNLSGVRVSRMRTMPEFLTLSPLAINATRSLLKKADESAKDYAVRLNNSFLGLRKSDISHVSGLNLNLLRRAPEFRQLTPAAEVAVRDYPQKKDEKITAYARRIKLANPHLTISDCSKLSGIDASNLRRMKIFSKMTPRSTVAGVALPRKAGECDLVFARRLKKNYSELTTTECAVISGCREYTLDQFPEFSELSAAALAAQISTPKYANEAKLHYGKRLLTKSALNLNIKECSILSGVFEEELQHIHKHRRVVYKKMPSSIKPQPVNAAKPSGDFTSQLNEALLREMYSDDWTITDILPPES